MPAAVYATSDDLTGGNWLTGDQLPSSVDRLLRSASTMVARACNRNPYTDQPTPVETEPLRDATCAQVTSWVLMGVDPARRGSDYVGAVKQASILDGSVTRDTTAATKAASDAVDCLCDEASAILLQAGLLYVPTPLFDHTGWLPSWGLDLPVPEPYWPLTSPASRPTDQSLLLAELDARFTNVDTDLDTIQETLMAFLPATNDVTKVDGPPNVIASSTTSASVPFGRRTVITGSAVQPLTVATPTVDGTRIEIKIADGSTASATLPAALQVSGVTGMTAGQDYGWFWVASSSTWAIN